jgi:uncharacterized Zn finger protein
MAKFSNVLSVEAIKKLSIPSNFKYGEAIYKRGGVEYIDFQPTRVEAWVGGLSGHSAGGGGQRRRVELKVSEEGLVWHCTGNPKKHDIFCKHCVALALTLINNG